MGKNREQKKEKKWNKKSSEKELLNSKYVRNKVKLMEQRQKKKVKVKNCR
tara:strand:+ start:772 stop:921 length:150 start_codon:yes stop_codon:yes gene_type:complete